MNETPNDALFDVLVVGAGLVGSAAARHLQEARPELSVALVGPDEAGAADAGVWGAHADEGLSLIHI